MKISVKGFIYHKEAETFEDCFDRYGINTYTNKFCVSDGVSKSFFPGIWAEMLVDSFLKTNGRVNLDSTEVLRSLQEDWSNKVLKIVNRPNQKYYVKNFFAQGRSAAATFVGLNFFKSKTSFKWESFALGDSFLFFVPKHITNLTNQFNEIIHLSSKKNFEFDNFPDFFESRGNLGRGKTKKIEHDLHEGVFYLMTDALSEWFIQEKQCAIQEIEGWHSQEIFENRITELRKIGLQNDDSTLLIIEVEEDNSFDFNYSIVSLTDLPIYDDYTLINEKTLDQTNSIAKKFTNNKNEINLLEQESRLLEEKLEHERQLKTKIQDFEKKINSNKKIGKKKKKKGFWEEKFSWLKHFFMQEKDQNKHDNDEFQIKARKNNNRDFKLNDENDSKSSNLSSSGDIDSISDKF